MMGLSTRGTPPEDLSAQSSVGNERILLAYFIVRYTMQQPGFRQKCSTDILKDSLMFTECGISTSEMLHLTLWWRSKGIQSRVS